MKREVKKGSRRLVYRDRHRGLRNCNEEARPVARRCLLLFLLLAIGLSSCRKDSPAGSPTRPRLKAVVSVLPQAYFVQRVGGEGVEADVLVGPGQDPHTFEPTPQQMARLSEAAVYFRIGMPFETRLLEKIASINRNLKVVDTAEGVELMDMPEGEAGHHHDTEPAAAGHPSGDKDPHIWLDPKLVKMQAETICRALVELDPPGADAYRANLAGFQDDLDRLDQRLAKTLAPLRGREFFVYHPAFGYFAAAYGLKQVAVETGGKEPGPRQVAELVERAKQQGVKVIFVQPQFSDKAARAIARQIGGVVVPMDDLPRDYIASMDRMAGSIEQALGKTAP